MVRYLGAPGVLLHVAFLHNSDVLQCNPVLWGAHSGICASPVVVQEIYAACGSSAAL